MWLKLGVHKHGQFLFFSDSGLVPQFTALTLVSKLTGIEAHFCWEHCRISDLQKGILHLGL
jgi:hypothetical protein